MIQEPFLGHQRVKRNIEDMQHDDIDVCLTSCYFVSRLSVIKPLIFLNNMIVKSQTAVKYSKRATCQFGLGFPRTQKLIVGIFLQLI
jgi:hypothetical protein